MWKSWHSGVLGHTTKGTMQVADPCAVHAPIVNAQEMKKPPRNGNSWRLLLVFGSASLRGPSGSHLIDHEASSGCSAPQAVARRCAGVAPWSQPWSHRRPQLQLIRSASLHNAAPPTTTPDTPRVEALAHAKSGSTEHYRQRIHAHSALKVGGASSFGSTVANRVANRSACSANFFALVFRN